MSGDRFRSSSPGTEALFLAGVILRDNSWRISRSASPCLRELIVSISGHCEIVNVHCEIVHWGIWDELAGWPRQLGSSTREVAAYLVERHFECLSQREAWVDYSRFGGPERPRAARVGLVLPASLLPSSVMGSRCGRAAAV